MLSANVTTPMMIESQLSENDYIKANFAMFYTKRNSKIWLGIVSFMALVSLIAVVSGQHIAAEQALVPFVMLFLFHFFIYRQAKKMFASDKKLGQPMQYHFDEEGVLIKSGTFSVQYNWETVLKLTKTKNWVFIWQNKQSANPIPIQAFSSAQLDALKQLVTAKQVKNRL